jgi:predicted SAM-dependent methyltransferase
MNNTVKKYLKFSPFIYKILKSFYRFYMEILSVFKWRKLALSPVIKLELGSGHKIGMNGWTTVDIFGADISRDLRNGIPLKNNSVTMLYTSHMFEHIPFKSLVIFLEECFRVLKVGGILSVCVPNSRLYIQAYIDGREFKDSNFSYKPAVVSTGSFLDQVNYIAYMDGLHSYMFDEENLLNTIKLAGFSKVNLRQFDPSLDIIERDYESIYAEAIK